MPKPILPPELAAELAPATLLVRGGSERSAYDETCEAMFLTVFFALRQLLEVGQAADIPRYASYVFAITVFGW